MSVVRLQVSIFRRVLRLAIARLPQLLGQVCSITQSLPRSSIRKFPFYVTLHFQLVVPYGSVPISMVPLFISIFFDQGSRLTMLRLLRLLRVRVRDSCQIERSRFLLFVSADFRKFCRAAESLGLMSKLPTVCLI